MSFNAYLKLDGIDGEIATGNHKGWIEVLSFSWGATNAGSIGSANAGAGAGKVEFQPFKVSKSLDAASPKLFLACVAGGHIKYAQVDLVRTNHKGTDVFFTYKLSDVFISSISDAGTSRGQDVPLEEVGLDFLKIEEFLPAVQTPPGTTSGIPPVTSTVNPTG